MFLNPGGLAKLTSTYVVVGLLVTLLVLGLIYIYKVHRGVVGVSSTPKPEVGGEAVPSTPVPMVSGRVPEVDWSELRRVIWEHPLAHQLKLDLALEERLPPDCIRYRYRELTWITVDYRGLRALIPVGEVLFCTYIDPETGAYTYRIPQVRVTTRPGFNLTGVPSEFSDTILKVVKLVEDHVRRISGRPEKVGLVALVDDRVSGVRESYVVAVVGGGRFGFKVDLVTWSMRFWFKEGWLSRGDLLVWLGIWEE